MTERANNRIIFKPILEVEKSCDAVHWVQLTTDSKGGIAVKTIMVIPVVYTTGNILVS
jgi:hypothetical protein